MRNKRGIPPKGHIDTLQAAKVLRVAKKTVIEWVRAGRLKGKIGSGLRPRIWVKGSSLGAAFFVTCAVCGKRFRAKHPQKAMYCSKKHKLQFFRDKIARTP